MPLGKTPFNCIKAWKSNYYNNNKHTWKNKKQVVKRLSISIEINVRIIIIIINTEKNRKQVTKKALYIQMDAEYNSSYNTNIKSECFCLGSYFHNQAFKHYYFF